jgi:hypothetical protein
MDKSALSDFLRYLDKEVEPAIKDLGNLTEKNRVHIQKLVYTNIVDRFDTMIDALIIDNCREEVFMDKSLADMSGNVTESELVKILVHGENLQGALDIKLRNGLRNTVLRERHSKKLTLVFNAFDPDIDPVNAQRVNLPTGKIHAKITPQKALKIPYSISGYADWLYSRRNSIVHGGGTNKFLENDRKQIKKIYKKEIAKQFTIKLSSVKVTVAFYRNATELLNA